MRTCQCPSYLMPPIQAWIHRDCEVKACWLQAGSISVSCPLINTARLPGAWLRPAVRYLCDAFPSWAFVSNYHFSLFFSSPVNLCCSCFSQLPHLRGCFSFPHTAAESLRQVLFFLSSFLLYPVFQGLYSLKKQNRTLVMIPCI